MDRPLGNTPEVHAECEKWYVYNDTDTDTCHADCCRDAWYAQRGLSRTEAKRRYISTLVDTMHRYASQTSEARELVSELEFVWDQIKFNASSSSSSSPIHNVGVPPLSGSAYGSIGGRLARSAADYERSDLRADTSRRGGRDSRLRVLSPVSQPEEEEYYRRRRVRSTDDDDVDDDEDDDDDQEANEDEEEEEEDEEYEEARDSLYEGPDHASTNTDTGTGTDRTASHGEERHRRGRHRHHQSVDSGGSGPGGGNPKDSRWRRRVEQALTKMTAEIAAVREQMEARTGAQRRRSGLFAWIKWLLWVALRQIIMDIALLGMLLIWMRMRGDRRVENRLRTGWSEVKARLGQFKLLKRIGVTTPMLP